MKPYVDSLSLGASEIGPPSPKFLEWITRRGIPRAASRFIGHMWVKCDDAAVGAINLLPESEIMSQVDDEPRWLTAGFLVIGSCGNGDMVAIDVRGVPGSVWFMSHEELWGDASADPRRFSVHVAQDLADLVVAANPERFVRRAPVAPRPPAAAWINPPLRAHQPAELQAELSSALH
jgi:uncharacterized membrane protein